MPHSLCCDVSNAAMADIDDLFARRVREGRERQGLSQEALSLRAGLHEKYVGQLERRERGATLRAADRLANALGLSLAALSGDVDRLDVAKILKGSVIREPPTDQYRSAPALFKIVAKLRPRSPEELALVGRVIEAILPEPSASRRPRRGD